MRPGREVTSSAALPPLLIPVTAPVPWLILQLADSAFPTGGFAHSGGLEAAVAAGEVTTTGQLDEQLRKSAWNIGHASLPFVGCAHDAPNEVWALDASLDAVLANHVANRASRTQGRTFVATCAQVFDSPAIRGLAASARAREVPAHLAPLFGAVLSLLGIERHQAMRLYLYSASRAVASAAVRLGVVGPLEAQRLLQKHASTMDAVLAGCESLSSEQASTVVPLLDILSATHDRLYARLFQS